ncbi:DnaB-like helicase N-terminal domain-containing protein [Streptomyces sp. NPDC058459]|uniref:DnaB-like helicase N-terminal domain-containing protein n=1 Tax=Streptomyces sp. NPDC058459 TaxID=3346508 RepID=UPI00364A8B6A
MPHAPESDEDDLDFTAPHQPVFHAEQALLGALLLDPHRVDDVSGIGAKSFSTAAHAALYTAITTLPRPDPAEHAKNATWLARVLTTAQGQARGLTASDLHTLVQVCPWPSHAPAYARMIEAEHARRRLLTAAERLAQTVHDTSLPHPLQTVFAETDALAAVVDDIGIRFPPRAGVLPRTTTPPPPPARDPAEAAEEERILLATATAYPRDIDSVRWLLPTDLTQPLHRGLWQCLTTLARRNQPVDPVTVLWEAQQRGVLDNGSDPREILRMLAEPASPVEHWGERALKRSLLATAEHTARRIEAYAEDPANTPFQLVIGARRALADIAAVRTRWQHATGATPPQRRQPPPTTRAGPPTTRAAHSARPTRAIR